MRPVSCQAAPQAYCPAQDPLAVFNKANTTGAEDIKIKYEAGKFFSQVKLVS